MITYVYRLYPSKTQLAVMEQTLDTCCQVYNSMVHWRKYDYEIVGKSPSKFEQMHTLSLWKKDHFELANIYGQVLQDVVKRVDLAYAAFFRRVKKGETPGFPRIKKSGYDSFTYPQYGFKVGTKSITLGKIGQVKARISRPTTGTIKTCTIRRRGEKWYACIVCDAEPKVLPESTESIGIDVGLKVFAAYSNGEFIENPRFFRQEEKALAKAQRKLSKKVVARIHERIRNRRHNFVHQLSRQIVNKYGIIAVEKLNVQGMIKNHCLAKSIADASWSMFRSILSQKAESARRKYVEINPAYTSQTCSGCGNIEKKTLSERQHNCSKCGLSIDRDINAALNILALGHQSFAGLPA